MMAAHVLKSIVNELTKDPFNFNLSVISFNSLQPLQLLQLLSDVLYEIESKDRVSINNEPVEKLVLRLMTSLQILKYKPDIEDPNQFRDALANGQPELIHPILHWLLQRKEELMKRAYLSRFLLKIEIPPEMNSDSDVIDMFEQYEFHIEEFKQIHRQWDSSQNVNDTVSDLRKDLATMEGDREVLVRRIERTQRKMETVANYQQLLVMAKKLRFEKDKSRENQTQKDEQKNLLSQLEARRQRLLNQLMESRQMNAGVNSQSLLQRVEDAIRVNQYMLNEKLPKEIEQRTNQISLMENIISSPNLNPVELEELTRKNEDIKVQIARLTEKRALANDPTEDGMALYRQQSLIVARKKEASAERLNQLRQEFSSVSAQLKSKKQQLGSNNEAPLTAEQFKTYVSDLRVKSNSYKQRRAELNDLKAEYGILSRTLEILKIQESSLTESMNQLELQKGVRGFRETRQELEKISEEKASTDEEKGRTLEEMSNLVRVLNTRIGDKKAKLAPLLRELRPLRQSYQEALPDYEARKREYDAQVKMIEDTIASVSNAKITLENDIALLEVRQRQLETLIQQGKLHLQRAAEEMKLYVSGVHEKGKSARDQLHQKITEQEKINSILHQDQERLKENLPNLEIQNSSWEKIGKIFQAKQLSFEREKRQGGTVRREKGRETLVLYEK